MASFTSWQALYTQLLNDLASGEATVKRYRTPDGREVERHTVAELQEWLGFVSSQASAEAQSATPGFASRRVHAQGAAPVLRRGCFG